MVNIRTRARLVAVLLVVGGGCAQPMPRPEIVEDARQPDAVTRRPPMPIRPDDPMAVAFEPPPIPLALEGPHPVDDYIRHALAENRSVEAARYNVLALRERIAQVTALDDPVVSNTIYPGSSNGLQTAAGYVPWNFLIAQQFPWFGTLGLRGKAAEQEVQVALAELATAQLDVVEAVKLAYLHLAFNERAEAILRDNRDFVEFYIDLARTRYETGQTTETALLSAEVVLVDLDRELVSTRQGIASARADLASLLHISPDADLRTIPAPSIDEVPEQLDRLDQLAVAARPELQGRLAAAARDETAVELARQRYKPNVTVGLNYGLVSGNGAISRVANGNDNIGLFVGFNLPIYRDKLNAGVREAQARVLADARLFEAERDGVYREIRDLRSRTEARRETLGLFTEKIQPRASKALEAAESTYQVGTIDILTLISAWREVLQIKLQIAQFESEVGRSLASLERAVGVQLSEHPPSETNEPATSAIDTPPPPTTSAAPFAIDDPRMEAEVPSGP